MQNLNADPVLPFGDSTFDAVICNVSVQYLQYPEQVGRVPPVGKGIRGGVWALRVEHIPFLVPLSGVSGNRESALSFRGVCDHLQVPHPPLCQCLLGKKS